MKLNASAARKNLDEKVLEKKLTALKEKRLRAEALRREKDEKIRLQNEALRIEVEQLKKKKEEEDRLQQIEFDKTTDIELLEAKILELALEGKARLEIDIDIDFDDLSYYNDQQLFSELSQYGFQMLRQESDSIFNVQYVIRTSNRDRLLEIEETLTEHFNAIDAICNRGKMVALLPLLKNHIVSDDSSINVESLAITLFKFRIGVQKYLHGDDYGPMFEEIEERIESLVEDLKYFDLDDPTYLVVYDQNFLSWEKKINSVVMNNGLLNGRYFYWIARQDGQRFFYFLQKAIDRCVLDLKSKLTLGVTVTKGQSSIVIISKDQIDAVAKPESETLLIQDVFFSSPLLPDHFIRVFEHLGFTTVLRQDCDEDPSFYYIDIHW
jgi:hypothetical protein